MSPLDARLRDWETRISRYRQLASLFREDELGGGRLLSLVGAMEGQLGRFKDLRTVAVHRRRQITVLLGEIDAFMAVARGGLAMAKNPNPSLRLSAGDLREASRLCREEARVTEDVPDRRALAGRALDLAMLGEKLAANGVAKH